MSDHNVSEFIDFCKNFDQAMLVTNSDRGLIARPMIIAEIDSHGDFWFSTDVASGKVDEIHNNPDVCITMTNASGNATVRGKASVVKDGVKIKDLWNETWRVWFPEGPTDPKLVLIKVDTSEGEFWATGGIQGWKYLFAMAKSYVRGERPKEDINVHRVVEL